VSSTAGVRQRTRREERLGRGGGEGEWQWQDS